MLTVKLTGLHGTNVDAERQDAATSIAYKRPRRILQYMGISRQLTLRSVNAAAFSEIYSVLGLLRRQKALLRQGG